MFDNVKFEGTINLGAICLAIIQLISAYTVLVRVRAMIEERNIKINIFNRKKKPQPTDQGDQGDQGDDSTKNPL